MTLSKRDAVITLNTQKYTRTRKLREKNFSELVRGVVENTHTSKCINIIRLPNLCSGTRYKLHKYFDGREFYTKSVDESISSRCLYIWKKQDVIRVLEEYLLPEIIHAKIMPHLDNIISAEKETLAKNKERNYNSQSDRLYDCDECGHIGDCNEILVSAYYPMKLCENCIENNEIYAASKWESALY